MQGLRPTLPLAALLIAAGGGGAHGGGPARPAAPPQAPPGSTARAPGDPCRDGLADERAGRLPPAFLALGRCGAGDPAASAALRRVKRRLEDGDYAPVSFSIDPPAAEVRIAPFTDRAPLRDPHTLWLPFGRHTWTARAPGREEVSGELRVDSRARIHLQVVLRPLDREQPPAAIDFEPDGPAVDEPIVVEDPRPRKHASLMPERFRGGLDRERARSGRPARRSPPARRGPARAWPWILTRGL